MSYVIVAEAGVLLSGMLLSLFTASVTVQISFRRVESKICTRNDLIQSYQGKQGEIEWKTQTRDYFSTLGSLLKWSIYALHVYSANAQEHNGNHSVTEIIQICYSDIDFLFKYAWLHGSLGRARLSMPSVFGMDGDIDDFKPWEENQAFQRSEHKHRFREVRWFILHKGLRCSDDHLAPVSSQNGLHWSFFYPSPFIFFLFTCVVACVFE